MPGRPVSLDVAPNDHPPNQGFAHNGNDEAVDGSLTRGLGLLASAIAGRRLTVVGADTEVTYTDRRQIFIDCQSDRRDARDAVALHAAFLAGGSFNREVVRQLSVRRSIVGTRYLMLESNRVAHLFAGILPRATVARTESLHASNRSESNEESLRRALSRETIPSAPPWIGSVKTRQLLRSNAEDLGAAPTGGDISGTADLDDGPGPPNVEVGDSEESEVMRRLSVPGMSNPMSRAIQNLLGMGPTKSSTGGGGAELSLAGQRVAPVGPHAKTSLLKRAVAAIFQQTPEQGTQYPEWNSVKQVYRPNWCTVALYDPAVRDVRAPQVTGDSLRRAVARVGLERRRHLRQSDGDSLDMSALIEYEVDRRLGDGHEPRIYARSLHTKRDLSVLVLLDSSGSTAEGSDGQTVFHRERQLALSLTESLESLGDHVATYGFYSQGRDSVRFLRVKEFSERFSGAARQRLQSIEPAGFTRFGAAIRHAGHMLESHALARNMILVYIGDGLPYDDGYEEGYARADSYLAIRETVQRGVGVIGLAIRSSTAPHVVQEIWSDAPFRVVTDTDDARRHVQSMMLDALRMTRTNGRRRQVSTADHHRHSETLLRVKRATSNSYV
jgi:hypothetical protein